MTTTVETSPATDASTAPGSDLNHVYCCDPNTAWCGTDISTHAEIDSDTPLDCVVCADLEPLPCPTCGN